jgi:hypothetical protein
MTADCPYVRCHCGPRTASRNATIAKSKNSSTVISESRLKLTQYRGRSRALSNSDSKASDVCPFMGASGWRLACRDASGQDGAVATHDNPVVHHAHPANHDAA